jgi:hypothetical protein
MEEPRTKSELVENDAYFVPGSFLARRHWHDSHNWQILKAAPRNIDRYLGN